MPASSSRAAEVLDRLAREHPRRTLYRRYPDAHDPDPRDGFDVSPADSASDSSLGASRHGAHPTGDTDHAPGRWLGRSGSPRRLLGIVAAVLCSAVALVAVLVDRRPPPVEEQLPLASEQLAPTPPSSVERPPSDTAASSASVPPASPDAAGANIIVHVAGAVAEPGVVELPGGSRVVDAVRAAGGLRSDADVDRINLAALLEDAQRVIVPVIGQEIPLEVVPAAPPTPRSERAPGASGDTGPRGAPDGPDAPIDLNSADTTALESLPGVGPATAAAILAHREREGPFRSVDGLLDVRGIGEAKLEALRDLVTVAGN